MKDFYLPKRTCDDGLHLGTFSFGCMPDVIRCDACGRSVSRDDVEAASRAIADEIAFDLPTKGSA